MVTKIKSLLRNRNFIFVSASACGMLFPYGSQWTEPLVLPILAIVMTLGTMGIPNSIFRSPRSLIIPALLGVLANYVILGNVLIGMSTYLIHEESLWVGFIITAAVPPAVAVIPVVSSLKGSEPYATAGTIGAYIGALIIIPLIAVRPLELHHVDTTKFLTLILLLIVLPIALSRIIIWKKRLYDKIAPVKGIVTKWCFFLIMYTFVGLNRDTIVNHPSSLVPVAFIAFASTFFLGFIIELIGTIFRFSREKTISLFLLGTLKNYGLAGGLALFLFNKEAALPATVAAAFMIMYTVWLNFKTQAA